MQKPIFVTSVTQIPAEWANSVSALVYDVFQNAVDLASVKTVLQLGAIASQDPSAVNITGGVLNNVVIGAITPRAATFTSVGVTQLEPTADGSLTTRHYVERRLTEISIPGGGGGGGSGTPMELVQTTVPCVTNTVLGTATFPFVIIPGSLVVFVNGLHQLPDTYTVTLPSTITFINVVGQPFNTLDGADVVSGFQFQPVVGGN